MRRPSSSTHRWRVWPTPGPVFHGLFRNSREAVAPVVSALWTAPTPVSEPVAQAPQPIVVTPARTDATTSLFQDQATDTRALFRGRV